MITGKLIQIGLTSNKKFITVSITKICKFLMAMKLISCKINHNLLHSFSCLIQNLFVITRSIFSIFLVYSTDCLSLLQCIQFQNGLFEAFNISNFPTDCLGIFSLSHFETHCSIGSVFLRVSNFQIDWLCFEHVKFWYKLFRYLIRNIKFSYTLSRFFILLNFQADSLGF